MTKTTDILTVLEVDAIIERATGGAYGADDATGVVVREVSSEDSSDGFAYWAVMVVVYDYRYVVKTFAHRGKASADSCAWDVADALGVEVG